jgi:hypothetical protein
MEGSMDRTGQLLQDLAVAEQHIALGERHISSQEMRIANLDCRGYDSTLARSLLQAFLLLQSQHVAHRDHILRELSA